MTQQTRLPAASASGDDQSPNKRPDEFGVREDGSAAEVGRRLHRREWLGTVANMVLPHRLSPHISPSLVNRSMRQVDVCFAFEATAEVASR